MCVHPIRAGQTTLLTPTRVSGPRVADYLRLNYGLRVAAPRHSPVPTPSITGPINRSFFSPYLWVGRLFPPRTRRNTDSINFQIVT